MSRVQLEKEDFPDYIISVSVCLRRHYSLKRLPAEWLCYRFQGLIKARQLEGHPAVSTAASLFDAWGGRLRICDEFHALFVALIIDDYEPKENTKCLPTIELSSGITSVPDGTEVK